jgi:predicted lipoprotein with Yx(FWY)xxD motif
MSTCPTRFPAKVRSRVLVALVITPLMSAGVFLPAGIASASSSPLLQALSIKSSPPAVVNAAHDTLYLLSSEKSGHLHCTGLCLNYWFPLLVKKSVTTITMAKGVKGKIGFVARSGGMKQVTFNSYPLYRFSGDARSLQTNGEGLVSYGGTWYAVKAAATSPSQSAIKSFASSTVGGY